jgi:periplasmic divalent cation tolerance protein
MNLRIVLTTVPDLEQGRRIGQALVEEGLAACVQCVPGLESIYVWKGQLQQAAEVQLVIKTLTDRLPELADRLADLHPYELPEFIVLAPEAAGSAYLAWVRTQTESGS